MYSVSEKRELFIKNCLIKQKVWYVLPKSNFITQLHCNSLYGVKIYRSIFWLNELQPIIDTISSFKDLKHNWGSYNEEPTTNDAIKGSIKLANRIYDVAQFVDVFPMRDGGIQFELRTYQNDAEIEVSTNGQIKMIFFDRELNTTESKFHLSKLRQYLNRSANF